MKRKLKLKKYNNGGDFKASDAVNTTGDIVSMIPGFRPIIGGLMKMGGSAIAGGEADNQRKMDKNTYQIEHQFDNHPQPSSPVMMALGGEFLKTNNAPSHANGGMNVDANGNPTNGKKAVAEIEKNETIADGYAFSPNLIDSLSGKTFAEASMKIEKKYKPFLENGDDISRWTRDKEMGRLKKSNDVTRAKVEQQKAMELATIIQGLQAQAQQAQQGVSEQANGGYLGDPIRGIDKNALRRGFEGKGEAAAQIKKDDDAWLKSQDIRAATASKTTPEEKAIIDDKIVRALQKSFPRQSVTDQMNKLGVTTLDNGGDIITPNDNPYSTLTGYDDTRKLFGSDKELQQSILDYGMSVGQKYLPKYGADGKAGTETKGFFGDPNNVKGYADYMNKKYQTNKNLTFNPSNIPVNPNQVSSMQISNMQTTPDTGIATADTVPMHEYLKSQGITATDFANAFSGVNKPNNLIDKSGNIIPMGEQRTDNTNSAPLSGAPNPNAGKQLAGKNKLKKFWGDLTDGKYTGAIGTGLKVGEVIGQAAMALRPADKIATQYNDRAGEAEREMRKRGQQLTSARTRNEQALNQSLVGNRNAMSQSVKFALDQAAQDKAALREIDIAGQEKSINDNVTAQLASMVTAHGTEAKNARDLQEVKQSQTNAVQADAVKGMFETMGNAGEFFAKKAATDKKADEQMMLIGQKYPNFTVTDRKTYNKAITSGDINGVIKFVKAKNMTLEQALEDADEIGMSKADKEKLKKKLKKEEE